MSARPGEQAPAARAAGRAASRTVRVLTGGQDPYPGAARRPRAVRSAPAAIPQLRSV